jgi:hypothetical protein
MSSRLSIGLSIVFAGIIANFAAPLFDSHSEQDNCTFGPVSNADYRKYLANARAQLAVSPSFHLDDNVFASKLSNLFNELSRNEAGIYARLAIMHATLRAAGAEYRNTNGNYPDRGRSEPFLLATTGAPAVTFNYLLDINRLWIFSPWPREAWVIGYLAGPLYARQSGPMFPRNTGGISFVVNGPDLEMRPLGYRESRTGSCPPVPTADVAHIFSVKSE